jgi:hypothetical protein
MAFMNVKKIFVDIFRAIHRATGRAAITYFQLRRRYLRSPYIFFGAPIQDELIFVWLKAPVKCMRSLKLF